MPAHLVACIYVCVAIGMAWVIGVLCLPQDRNGLSRAALGAVIATVAAFTVPSGALFMMIVATTCIVMSPKDIPGRMLFYCAMLPVLPVSVAWTIPFPGINYLYTLQYPALLGLAILVPAYFHMKQGPEEHKSLAGSSKPIVVVSITYFLLVCLLDFRETSFTNGLRNAVDVFLSYGLIVLVLARASLAKNVSDSALVGLLIGGLFVASVGIVQELVYWLLYDQIHPALRQGELRYDYAFAERGGSLRIPSTMGAIPLGTFLGLAFCIGLYSLLQRRANALIILPLIVFVYCVVETGSRGAILGMAISFALFIGFSNRLQHLRRAVFAGILIAASVSLVVFDVGERVLEADQHTTFQYRLDLIYNSWDSISRHPLFGTPNYLENPVLELSRQGQGIIDIVNAYLAVTLRYGFIGLLLFSLPFFWSAKALLARRRALERHRMANSELKARIILVLIIGYAVTIATVSLVDRLAELYWVFIALAAGISGQLSSPLSDPSSLTRSADGKQRYPEPAKV